MADKPDEVKIWQKGANCDADSDVLAKIGNGGPLHSQWNSFKSPEKYMKYLYQLAKLFTVHITEEFTKLFRDEDG